MIKVNKIMLVDDDEVTNFLNEDLLSHVNVCSEILVIDDSRKALDSLNSIVESGDSLPEIIFFDINMPGLNGWEFIAECKDVLNGATQKSIVVMLSSSVNIDDQIKANQIDEIDEFISKPLTDEKLNLIMDKYFAE